MKHIPCNMILGIQTQCISVYYNMASSLHDLQIPIISLFTHTEMRYKQRGMGTQIQKTVADPGFHVGAASLVGGTPNLDAVIFCKNSVITKV